MAPRVVFGVGPVRELVAVRPGDVTRVITAARSAGKGGGALSEILRAAAEAGIEVGDASPAELERLAQGGNHQGIVALTGEYRYVDLEQIFEVAAVRGEAPLVVALDSVTDPHNLGAIVRSAHLLGAHGIVVPRDRSARVTPVVTKASAGATELVAIAQVTNLARALEEAKERSAWVAGVAAGPGAQVVWELDASGALVLVFGSEGRGIRPLVDKVCDFRVAIPMAAIGVGSFNVSVAAGIALYEVARQRMRSSAPKGA